MNDVLKIMKDFNDYLRENKIQGTLSYHGETSHFVRAGNSEISLNTSTSSSLFTLTLQCGRRKISRGMSVRESAFDDLKKESFQMLRDLKNIPELENLSLPQALPSKEKVLQPHFDERVSSIDKEKVIELFEKVDQKFKNTKALFSGAFSAGEYFYAMINTESIDPLFQRGTDFDIEVVLQLPDNHNKELRAIQVGEDFSEFHPEDIVKKLEDFYQIKTTTKRVDVDPGEYDVIFSAEAITELLSHAFILSFCGEYYEYGVGMFGDKKDSLGKKYFSDKLTLIDLAKDVSFKRNLGRNGILRKEKNIIDKGVLSYRYYSDLEDCDFFRKELNDDIFVSSIKMLGGTSPGTLDEIIKETKKKTIFINYVHYINFTNQNKGEFTGTSRFGTLLLEDSKLNSHLFNLRINDSFFNIFSQIDWMSKDLINVSHSDTYSRRNPSIYRVPKFMKVNGVKISASAGTSM